MNDPFTPPRTGPVDKSTRALVLEYDSEDIDGYWSFVASDNPMTVSSTNLDFMRIGAFAKLVAEEIEEHVGRGTDQRTFSIY